MKLSRLISFVIPVAIVLFSFFAWQPLLHKGFFSMHDNQQVVRLDQLHKSLVAGQFPVRWVADLGFGYGYPLFDFYPPFVYYFGEIFHLLGFGLIDSVKLIWFFAIILSGFSMYLFARENFGKFGGLVSALFYIYAPYHAVDAYVRGALAELFSFVWLPLILYSCTKQIKNNSLVWSIVTGIFLGFLMITHNLIFLPFVGLYTLWALFYSSFTDRKNILAHSGNFIISLFVAFGLTGFFWLPALLLKQYTLVDQILIKSLASYTIHFVCPEQLWNSLWGFGGSAQGCIDGMSFKIGKLHIFTAVVALITFVVSLRRRSGRQELVVVLIAFGLLLFSAFMTTQYSKFIWDSIPQLWYLQFPWRFLEFIVLFTSFLAGSLFIVLSDVKKKALVAIVLISVLIYGNMKLFTPQTFYTDTTDQKLTSDEETKWNVSSSSFEYMPNGVRTIISEKNTVWVDITKDQISKSKFYVLVGDFKETKLTVLPHRIELVGESKNGAIVRFPVTNFPGWQVQVNGKKVEFSDANKLKLIMVDVGPGNSKIVVDYGDTIETKIGNLITLITLASLLILAYAKLRNKK